LDRQTHAHCTPRRWLYQYIINSIEEAQHFATQWLWTCNNDPPTMGIGGITSAMNVKMAA
jgi:putative transposase